MIYTLVSDDGWIVVELGMNVAESLERCVDIYMNDCYESELWNIVKMMWEMEKIDLSSWERRPPFIVEHGGCATAIYSVL